MEYCNNIQQRIAHELGAPLSEVCFILDAMTVTSDARHVINAYFIVLLL